jgi:hypothetical protein
MLTPQLLAVSSARRGILRASGRFWAGGHKEETLVALGPLIEDQWWCELVRGLTVSWIEI